MKTRLLALIMVAVLFSNLSAFADEKGDKAAASESAKQWLALVDAGNYAASWDAASSLFKNHVSKEDWAKMVSAVRTPLGKVVSRKLKSADYTTSVPGGPDGQYVVIQYDSSFENKKSATETVTPMLDKDGRWRVSGYFIK
jgi:hypothetical protein